MEFSHIIDSSTLDGNLSQENIIKLILAKLKQKYSMKKIIDNILSESVNKDNKDKNNNNELDNIISLICQNTGASNLFKYLIDISKNHNNLEKENKISIYGEENNKRISLASTIEEDLININPDINDNVINIKEEDDYNNINDHNQELINFQNDDDLNLKDKDLEVIDLGEDDDVISIDDDNDIDNYILEDKEEIVILSEIDEKNNNKKLGIKNEKIIKGNNRISSLDKYKINDEQKNQKKIKNLSFHLSILQNYFFKYKFKSYNNKGIAKFICCNPKCMGYGEYNINNKLFTLLKEHNISQNLSCTKMDDDDQIYYSYMKNNNIEELQILNK